MDEQLKQKTKPKITVGVSSCLIGEKVRYNGQHKRDKFVDGVLSEFFEWRSFCPEVAIGLGIPRPTIKIERDKGEFRLVESKSGNDHTEKMLSYSLTVAKKIAEVPIFGYIFKSKSPSCGLFGVKITDAETQQVSKKGIGIYADILTKAFPNLPVEEEGRLNDPIIRENWIARVYAYHKFKTKVATDPTIKNLVCFHTEFKFTVLSHCERAYRELGRLVANADGKDPREIAKAYETLFMTALRKKSSRKSNLNVLLHVFGFFKKKLDRETKNKIIEVINDYKDGIIPLVVPVTLLNHYVRLLRIDYLLKQDYLRPHPKKLCLRNSL